MKLRRCRKRAVIAGRTGRTGPSLRVRTTQSERHGGCTADEIAPVTRTHGCGVPSARRRSPADVDDYPLAAGIWLPVKRPARRDRPTVALGKCHWPRCRHLGSTRRFGCCPALRMSRMAALMVMMCGYEMTPPVGVRRGRWCSGCRGGVQSAVTSAMAVWVEDSSTMALLAPIAATRACGARLLTARG